MLLQISTLLFFIASISHSGFDTFYDNPNNHKEAKVLLAIFKRPLEVNGYIFQGINAYVTNKDDTSTSLPEDCDTLYAIRYSADGNNSYRAAKKESNILTPQKFQDKCEEIVNIKDFQKVKYVAQYFPEKDIEGKQKYYENALLIADSTERGLLCFPKWYDNDYIRDLYDEHRKQVKSCNKLWIEESNKIPSKAFELRSSRGYPAEYFNGDFTSIKDASLDGKGGFGEDGEYTQEAINKHLEEKARQDQDQNNGNRFF